VHAHGAKYIIAAFGMTLRDRQRAYYYAQLDRLFPGVRQQYERAFGEKYSASTNNARKLEGIFRDECKRLGIATRMPQFAPQKKMAQPTQPKLF
jgi:hypothetical protein